MTSGDPGHFDRSAEAYAAVRPGYPAEVVAALQDWGALPPGADVLELGPGTGQATRQLLDAGASRILAVELGPELAHRLQADLPDPRLQVVVGDADVVDLPRSAFDLAAAATSFHWLDPARALPRLADALRDGGHLAVWWNVFGDPEQETPFRRRLDELLGSKRATVPWQLRTEERFAALTACGLFEAPRSGRWRWTRSMTTEETMALFSTFSDLADRPGLIDAIGLAVDELGGRIEERYVTALYVVRKR